MLVNGNPIDMSIERISMTLPKTTIQLTQMLSLNGTEIKAGFKRIISHDDITNVRII